VLRHHAGPFVSSYSVTRASHSTRGISVTSPQLNTTGADHSSAAGPASTRCTTAPIIRAAVTTVASAITVLVFIDLTSL
jgi:hypothetical protein